MLLRIIISWGTNVPVTEGHVSGLRLELAGADVVSHRQPVHVEEPGNHTLGNLLHSYRKVIIPVSLRTLVRPPHRYAPDPLHHKRGSLSLWPYMLSGVRPLRCYGLIRLCTVS